MKALAKDEGVRKYYKMSKTELLNVLTPTPPKMPSNVINLYKDVISNREADNLDVINFIPIEKAFKNRYRRYKVNAIMKIGVESFLNKTRKNLIDLIEKNLKELVSAKIQATLYLKWKKEEKDGTVIFIDKAFNSKLTEIFQGSDFNEVLDGMFIHMKKQIEHPAFPESGFVLEKILYLDISFSKLILTRGSSYLPLPDLDSKKGSYYQS